MKVWKYHPNTYDENLVKRHDDNSAINTSTAKDADGPGLVRRAGLPGYAVDHSERNVVEYLLEDNYVAAGWCCVIHNTLPSGRIFDLTPARFHLLTAMPVG